jgi:Flp pilus assembly protein TadB
VRDRRPAPGRERPPEVTVGIVALAVGALVGLLTLTLAPVGWAVVVGLVTAVVLGVFFRSLLRSR